MGFIIKEIVFGSFVLMKIVGIIPARGGSKGIPRKNIKLLAGKPLVSYTIDAAIKSKYIDKVIVSTEDDEIAVISKKFGAEVIKRPFELAHDETKTAPVVVHIVKELELIGYFPDIIVLLQATSPLRNEHIIDAALEKLINSGNDSIFTGFKMGYTMPVWKRNNNGQLSALYNYHLRPRRQDENLKEKTFCENGAMYAIKRDAFNKTQDFLGDNVDIFEMEYQIDIDTLKDFDAVENLIINAQQKNDTNSECVIS